MQYYIPEAPNTSVLLKTYYKKNRIYLSALARRLQWPLVTLSSCNKAKTIKVSRLWAISYALRYNFFQDLADQLPADFSGSRPATPEKDIEMAELKRQIEILQAEKNILLEAIKSKII